MQEPENKEKQPSKEMPLTKLSRLIAEEKVVRLYAPPPPYKSWMEWHDHVYAMTEDQAIDAFEDDRQDV